MKTYPDSQRARRELRGCIFKTCHHVTVIRVKLGTLLDNAPHTTKYDLNELAKDFERAQTQLDHCIQLQIESDFADKLEYIQEWLQGIRSRDCQ
jgi:hypothetical protein